MERVTDENRNNIAVIGRVDEDEAVDAETSVSNAENEVVNEVI